MSGFRLSQLATNVQVNRFLLTLSNLKRREEAIVLTEWFRTNDVRRLIAGDDPLVRAGPDPPDFLLIADGTIAVEVSRSVTERKMILDKSPSFPGLYTSTLRRTKADAAFHAALEAQTFSDYSTDPPRPHTETTFDLDRDYFSTIKPLLHKKAQAAIQYSPLYKRTVILIDDRLSEFEFTLARRMPELRTYVRSLKLPPSVEVVVFTPLKRPPGAAHRL
jgi:hypothetical protein